MGSPRTAAWIVVLFSLAGTAEAQNFTDVTAGSGLVNRGVKDGGLVWADFDDDGFLDVLVNSGRSHLYFQRPGADPPFEEVTDVLAPGIDRLRSERAAVAGDLNNDGWVDFARTDQELFEIYLNRGPPDFRFGDPATGDPDYVENPTTDPGADAYEGLGIFDYDGDGWLDIAMDEDGAIRIYQNPADGTAGFTIVDPMVSGLDADPPGNGDYIAVTDWDLDGRVDVLSRNDGSRDLWHHEPGGTFTGIDLGDLSSPNGRRGGSRFCDMDNDGDFDLVYTSGSGTGINRVWIQNDLGEFVDSGLPDITGTNNDDVACGDVDNDGDLDLYYSQNDTDALVINELIPSGVLTYTRIDGLGDENGEGVALVDWDQDGDLDLYVNQWGGSVTDPVTMMSSRTAADNALFQNDTDNDAYLAVTLTAVIDGCPTPSITRSDIGAWARLSAVSGDWDSGVREVNGGQGHGTQGSPVLHFGLGAPATDEYVLTIGFQYGGPPEARIRVTPASLGAYQHIEILGTDPDGDTIPTAIEVAAAGTVPDPDGDGFDAWNDDDADGDGILDADEAGPDPCNALIDSDGDGLPDLLDAVFDVPADGAVPDTSLIPIDTGSADGATDVGFTPGVQVHGSGCVACTVARADDGIRDARGLATTAIVLLFAGVRRRRRH